MHLGRQEPRHGEAVVCGMGPELGQHEHRNIDALEGEMHGARALLDQRDVSGAPQLSDQSNPWRSALAGDCDTDFARQDFEDRSARGHIKCPDISSPRRAVPGFLDASQAAALPAASTTTADQKQNSWPRESHS